MVAPRGCDEAALDPDPHAVLLPVPAVRQTESHDCGLACVAAALAWARDDEAWADLSRVKTEYSVFSGRGRPEQMEGLWTVELLAFVQSVVGGAVEMATTQCEVDVEYAGMPFYNSQGGTAEEAAAFDADLVRINALYDSLSDAICPQPYSRPQLLAGLRSGGCVFIVLVDDRRLRCLCRLRPEKDRSSPCGCRARPARPPSPTRDGFLGHYVVLIGLDEEEGVYYYTDPNTTCAVCRSRFDDFDAARSCFGTDDDVLRLTAQE
eukprot:TRINITY_DN23654_c0_g1_i1.p2 TRINITY_DN23654_c0_g1~~TRINITY_DN23654_c0_g1_i1.p2  ORF type:complete len:264 (+),score=89.28 TRINITY_DN23654_c0_g1_i1:30-821(+)